MQLSGVSTMPCRGWCDGASCTGRALQPAANCSVMKRTSSKKALHGHSTVTVSEPTVLVVCSNAYEKTRVQPSRSSLWTSFSFLATRCRLFPRPTRPPSSLSLRQVAARRVGKGKRSADEEAGGKKQRVAETRRDPTSHPTSESNGPDARARSDTAADPSLCCASFSSGHSLSLPFRHL